MQNNRFKRDMHIKFMGREYSIQQRLPNGDLQIKDVITGECKAQPEMELVAALFDSQLEFIGDAQARALLRGKASKSFVDDINMLKDNDPRKKEFKRRYAYIVKIKTSNLTSFTRSTLEPLIKEVSETIKDQRKPYWMTVYYRWLVPFIASGGDVRVLVPSYKSRGDRSRKFSGSRNFKGSHFSLKEKEKAKEIAEIVQDVIDEEYLKEQRLSVQGVYDILEIRIAEINRFRDVSDQLPIPHKSSIYDIVSKLDEYEKDSARYGKKYADHKHRCNKQGPRPSRILERVEMDHTTVDLFVLDDELMLPIGRPTITVAIDKFSRMILGIYVSFNGPGYQSVMQCLLHAIKPKTYLKAQFPNVVNDWDTYGIPELIVVDNGPEFYSEDFEDACIQIGTETLYSPIRLPRYKASIERFFGTLNSRLLHRQPGTTFSNIFKRKDYDPKENALISFNSFMEILHTWIVDVYHQSIHRGLKDIPAHVWKEGVAKFPPTLPRRQEDLRVLLGHIEHRTIGPSGVELFTLFYNCEELALLRRASKDEKFALKIDPDDISMIYVYDHKNDKYIPVPAVDQEYTKGLSLWQHLVIKNYARQLVRGRVNIEALRRAKKRIQEIVDREWVKPQKSGLRSKMARWKGVRQQDYEVSLRMELTQGEQFVRAVKEPKPLLSLISSPSPWMNISDACPPAFHEITKLDEGTPQYAATTAQLYSIKETKISRNGSDSASLKISDENERDEELSEVQEDDGELDMTGFHASFNLPAKGIK